MLAPTAASGSTSRGNATRFRRGAPPTTEVVADIIEFWKSVHGSSPDRMNTGKWGMPAGSRITKTT